MLIQPPGENGPPPLEIHLRRMPVVDALWDLEQYLDRAFLARLGTVRVVHGKGTGVMREAVRELLSQHPLVKRYRQADLGEGDAGVTVVDLEERGEPTEHSN